MDGGIEACSCGNNRMNVVDGFDDIGGRLLVDLDQNGRLAVGQSGIAAVFE